MRWRTLRPSSSFFVRSLGLSGSRCPSAHWPCPALRRGGRGLFSAIEVVGTFLERLTMRDGPAHLAAGLLLAQRVCHTGRMSSPVLLVARLHVDLQRVQSAVCRVR